MLAAISTGSMVDSGRAPCPPFPYTVMRSESAAALENPGVIPTCPTAIPFSSCMATPMSGRGNRVNNPSWIILLAPVMISSAGWPTSTSVPCHVSLLLAMMAAVP